MILKKKNYHLLFLLILSIGYIFPLIFFGKLTTFYHDNLDSMVVYNHVIGKIYREGFNIEYANIFLAGEIKTEAPRKKATSEKPTKKQNNKN